MSKFPQANLTSTAAYQKIDLYWPQVKEYVQKQTAAVAIDLANNNACMTKVFEGAYEVLLPLPLRLILPKDTFVKYCFSHREQLVARITSPRTETNR